MEKKIIQIIKNHKITKKKNFDGFPLNGYVAS